jgi:hypothetical protein
MGDKISGAMMKLKGAVTRRPGVKVSDFSSLSFYFLRILTLNRPPVLEECMEQTAEEAVALIRMIYEWQDDTVMKQDTRWSF